MTRDPISAQLNSSSITPPASGIAPAVEIVTALGDSVLEVDQLTPAPARSARSRMFLTIGGGLLLAAATTFGLGVRDAAHEARAREQWRDRRARPGRSVPPTTTRPPTS